MHQSNNGKFKVGGSAKPVWCCFIHFFHFSGILNGRNVFQVESAGGQVSSSHHLSEVQLKSKSSILQLGRASSHYVCACMRGLNRLLLMWFQRHFEFHRTSFSPAGCLYWFESAPSIHSNPSCPSSVPIPYFCVSPSLLLWLCTLFHQALRRHKINTLKP